ncbi:MAG: hypothetical protein EZS28_003892 [Streblomastix strix]|uniref:Uncharacterized protein n=1 Tax=Streblomastix strix TaxID=222440 RepID=A0A5J4X0K0_9EUKA|nr:MAG: hypothetical protein EZS28_003892 [Streblomastix strix]
MEIKDEEQEVESQNDLDIETALQLQEDVESKPIIKSKKEKKEEESKRLRREDRQRRREEQQIRRELREIEKKEKKQKRLNQNSGSIKQKDEEGSGSNKQSQTENNKSDINIWKKKRSNSALNKQADQKMSEQWKRMMTMKKIREGGQAEINDEDLELEWALFADSDSDEINLNGKKKGKKRRGTNVDDSDQDGTYELPSQGEDVQSQSQSQSNAQSLSTSVSSDTQSIDESDYKREKNNKKSSSQIKKKRGRPSLGIKKQKIIPVMNQKGIIIRARQLAEKQVRDQILKEQREKQLMQKDEDQINKKEIGMEKDQDIELQDKNENEVESKIEKDLEIKKENQETEFGEDGQQKEEINKEEQENLEAYFNAKENEKRIEELYQEKFRQIMNEWMRVYMRVYYQKQISDTDSQRQEQIKKIDELKYILTLKKKELMDEGKKERRRLKQEAKQKVKEKNIKKEEEEKLGDEEIIETKDTIESQQDQPTIQIQQDIHIQPKEEDAVVSIGQTKQISLVGNLNIDDLFKHLNFNMLETPMNTKLQKKKGRKRLKSTLLNESEEERIILEQWRGLDPLGKDGKQIEQGKSGENEVQNSKEDFILKDENDEAGIINENDPLFNKRQIQEFGLQMDLQPEFILGGNGAEALNPSQGQDEFSLALDATLEREIQEALEQQQQYKQNLQKKFGAPSLMMEKDQQPESSTQNNQIQKEITFDRAGNNV